MRAIAGAGPGGQACTTARGFVQGAASYECGNPTPAEQAHLEAVIRSRANPLAEAPLAIDLFEGVAPGAIAPPCPPPLSRGPLRRGGGLPRVFFHNSTDGDALGDWIIDAGCTPGVLRGKSLPSIQPGALEEEFVLVTGQDSLFVDEGVEGREHCFSILNPLYRGMGLGKAHGPCQDSPYGYMATYDFGAFSGSADSLLLGVVYDDLDQD